MRQIQDHEVKEAHVYRYECTSCRHTLRYYLEGVDQDQQCQQLRKLASLCWILRLSYRGIAAVFAMFGIGVSRKSAWRDTAGSASVVPGSTAPVTCVIRSKATSDSGASRPMNPDHVVHRIRLKPSTFYK